MPLPKVNVNRSRWCRPSRLGIVVCTLVAVGGETEIAAQPADPIIALNTAARAAYRRAREDALAHAGPIILVEGDNLVLRRGQDRIQVRFIPELYHTLKTVAHLPLGLDAMLMPLNAGGRCDEPLRDELRQYRTLAVAAQARIASLGLPRALTERQEAIIGASLEMIDAVLESGVCAREQRLAFTRRMGPLLLANAAAASRAAIDSLHRLVNEWNDAMPGADWERVTVVILGRQTPRQGNLATQYFARRLGVSGEGMRIIYAEGLFDESDALGLLATRLVDGQAAVDFFDDPSRLYRDLLADGATQYLSELFGKRAPEAPASSDRKESKE